MAEQRQVAADLVRPAGVDSRADERGAHVREHGQALDLAVRVAQDALVVDQL